MDKRKIRAITPFLERVKKKYSPRQVILFGSRARGTQRKDSDYDVLIVAESFKNINFYTRSVLMYKLKGEINASMDIVCLTPQEFDRRKKEIGIIQEACREGIEI